MKQFAVVLMAFIFVYFVPRAAHAVVCQNYPYTLQNGQTADANQVMSDFNLIAACVSTTAAKGVNSDITSLTGLTTPLSVAQGGTGNASGILPYLPLTGGTLTGTLNGITETLMETGTASFHGAANQSYGLLQVLRTQPAAGGDVGYVNPGMRCYDQITAATNNYEWCILGIVDVSAPGVGQHVGGYFQGNRLTSGSADVWGAVAEVRDESGQNDPTTSLVGLEVDNRGNGTDANVNRIGIDIVGARYNTSGAGVTIGDGLEIQNGGDTSVVFGNEIALTGNTYAGMTMSFTQATLGLQMLGNYSQSLIQTYGATTTTGHALLMGAGQDIGFESTGRYTLSIPTVNSGHNIFSFGNNGVEEVGVNAAVGSAGVRIGGFNALGASSSYAIQATGSAVYLNQPTTITQPLTAAAVTATAVSATSVASSGPVSGAGLSSTAGATISTGAVLAASATTGFLNIPAIAGTPTSTPAPPAGSASLVWDSSDNKLCVGYPGTGWKCTQF